MVEYTTAAEVAKAFSVSKSHVYRLAQQEKIPCARLGRSVRFNLEQVNAIAAFYSRRELKEGNHAKH